MNKNSKRLIDWLTTIVLILAYFIILFMGINMKEPVIVALSFIFVIWAGIHTCSFTTIEIKFNKKPLE